MAPKLSPIHQLRRMAGIRRASVYSAALMITLVTGLPVR